MKVCVVGYALNAKKLRKSELATPLDIWKGGGLADILDYKNSDQVLFVPFDSEEINSETHYDVIIHKLTEDLDQIESPRILSVTNYVKLHPNVVLIDPFLAVRKVLCRARTCSTLRDIEIREGFNCPFAQPNHIVISESQPDATVIHDSHIKFPVICKRLQACGTPASHSMVVVVDMAGFDLIERPILVQQYVNHDSVLYKAYVIDEEILVFRRDSLPNLNLDPNCGHSRSVQANDQVAQVHTLAFDSRYKYPTIHDFTASSNNLPTLKSSSKQVESNDLDMVEFPCQDIPHMDLFTRTATLLSQQFGLSLFGFDVIIESPKSQKNSILSDNDDATKLLVIDVNYFPSYKEVSDFPQRLRRFLRRKSGIDARNIDSPSIVADHIANVSYNDKLYPPISAPQSLL